MMDKETLRKADIFSGSLILILGLCVVGGAMQMPMKDSWGGVQNVWFVSPALFPLLVGGMLAILGILLIITALKSVGLQGINNVFAFVFSAQCISFARQPLTVRFYGAIFNLIFFVFLLVPRVDFFPAAILFLLIFFFMFYLGDYDYLLKILAISLAFSIFLLLVVVLGLQHTFDAYFQFSIDWIVIAFIVALCGVAWISVRKQAELKRKFRLSLIIAFAAPLTIGIIFKYFLLVPMPCEGLIVQVLDSIWYAELWS